MAVQYYCHVSWSRDTDVYLTYILFGIILTQFYVNFSRQEHQIDFLKVSFNSWDSQVSAYTSFHFSFTVPLNKNLRQIGQWVHELGSNIKQTETQTEINTLYIISVWYPWVTSKKISPFGLAVRVWAAVGNIYTKRFKTEDLN